MLGVSNPDGISLLKFALALPTLGCMMIIVGKIVAYLDQKVAPSIKQEFSWLNSYLDKTTPILVRVASWIMVIDFVAFIVLFLFSDLTTSLGFNEGHQMIVVAGPLIAALEFDWISKRGIFGRVSNGF